MNMGVLDALIISEEYREQVYSLDPGVCDKYIFSDVSHVKENLTQILDVDNGEQDILLYHSISNILSAIGFGSRRSRAVIPGLTEREITGLECWRVRLQRSIKRVLLVPVHGKNTGK
mgnify:CR=1 FL=1